LPPLSPLRWIAAAAFSVRRLRQSWTFRTRLHLLDIGGASGIYSFSNVLHDWGVPEIRELLAISYGALPAKGIVVVHDAFINDEKTGPLPVAEYSTLLLHSTKGKCYSIAEYSAFLREAGFVPGTYQDTGLDRGFMVAR